MTETTRIPLLKRKPVRWAWLAFLILLPILLWLTPADYFDARSVSICPSEFIFGIDCFSCDITRGFLHMHHFEVEDAVYFNVVSPFIYVAFVIIWFMWLRENLQALGVLKKKGSTKTA